MLPILINGLILGWSVAWPPGPVNAEIIRRGLMPKSEGGGFWPAWQVGLGACAGDFLWALGVATGAGALLNRPNVRVALGIISLGLLVVLAAMFALSAWKTFGRGDASNDSNDSKSRSNFSNGLILGFVFALTSPWNLGFWLAVIGSQQNSAAVSTFLDCLLLASAVVLGAVAWTVVLSVAVRSGARIFARPVWQAWTQVLTAGVMIYFATRLAYQLFV